MNDGTSPTPDPLGKAFGEAVDLRGAARKEYIDRLRQSDPATAAEVESLLGYHDEPETELETSGKSDTGTVRSMGGGSLLDRPAALLFGKEGGTLGNDAVGATTEDEPPLIPGTLLTVDGQVIETGDQPPESAGGDGWTYKIIRELGRGGMGVVYEAVQALPSRRVALKLLRASAGTHGGTRGTRTVPSMAARRLSLEAEALGALHHRGIAQVYAAGTLHLLQAGGADGPRRRAWLYIAMELIDGPTLGAWAKGKSVRDKVAAVAELCDAVEHAHQRGVVHRDLKPSNVLIDGATLQAGASPPTVAQPKVLDFGVARFTKANGDDDRGTISIGHGQIIGTLRYMSPEQARGGKDAAGLSVDGRSDVYALGAILYDLITGTPPIPVDDASIAGAVERIANQRPARCNGLAEALGKRRAADLQTVLDKALEKNPADRYQHALDLGTDLRRILADEPIAARPPTTREQVYRLVRRNRVATAGVAAGLALLVIGASVAVWQAVRATKAAEKAREEASVSSNALYFMGRMISAGTPRELRGQDITVREMLRTSVSEVRAMADNRATATACRLLAEALQEIGEPTEAEPLARRALAIDRRLLQDDDTETIEAAVLLSNISAQLGRQTEAVAEARAWRKKSLDRYGPDHPLSFRTAMALEFALGGDNPTELAECESILRDTIERMRRYYPKNNRSVQAAMNDLAALLMSNRRGEEAVPIAREVYDNRLAELGEDHPDTLLSMNNLASALASVGDFEHALELNTKSVPLSIKVLGADHPSTLFARQSRAQLLLQQGRFAEAEPEAKAVWEGRVKRLGPTTRPTLGSRGLYITCILVQKRIQEAEPMVHDLVKTCEETFGKDDQDTLLAVTLEFDLAEAKNDKAGLEAVSRRLKGTRYDPEKLNKPAADEPPVNPAPDADKSSTPQPARSSP